MHNLENPNFETSFDQEYTYELEPEFAQDSEGELLPAYETPDYEYTYEGEYDQEYGYEGEYDQEVLQEEVQLAEELSSISTEDELGAFLSGIARKATGLASNFISSPTGQTVLKKLKDIGAKTLPNLGGKYAGQIGSAIGGKIGGQTGAALGKKILSYGGQKLGSYAGGRFLDYIKFATNAIRNAANKPGPPSAVSKAAIIEAAKKNYPIILRKKRGGASGICGKCSGEMGYEDEYMGQEIYSEEISDGEIFNEVDEMQLASELLSITNEDELDQFIGGLFKKAARAVKGFARSTVGRTLGGMLKKVAKKALPFAAGALGTAFGGPVGGMIGSKLGTFASGLFEIEPEGLSAEDMEFAAARGFVRFAGNAARLASRTRPVYPPSNIARNSFIKAARRHAPGLLKRYNLNTFTSPSYGPGTQNGTWYRQGNSIIIQGA